MFQFPTTPLSSHKLHPSPSYPSYKPTNSSPLAATNSSPGSSPIAAVQARRRSQYKAQPVASTSSASGRSARHPPRLAGLQFGGGEANDDAQKAFLRTRLKLRCVERASKARERAVKKKRFMGSSEAGSDDMDMDAPMDRGEDDDEEAEDPMFDELFSRIMRNAERKTQHAYLYSYDREVGSDPAIDDATWETELAAQDEAAAEDDDAALEAYLAEQAAFADFADIPADELFSWSDLDEELLSGGGGGDVEMS
ncbi:hypothetical protein B0H17DRAFT_1181265 [Mycena rosella]|uniref:Uncharacterized protein n=1 Tax=Mycena rosella TaxID=1033263 RepID=A0AAD7D9F9_MYCRO|nr:hypothetical protein B0H17DRAFT_1181265 [Mycena rosella]